VCFAVRDTGIGIAQDRIARLFDPFAQADAGTTRQFGGTGLGLTISLELTQLMGGTMTAESKLGTGSTFRFQIPFAPATAEVRARVPAGELRGLRVLVVDDNATNRRIFEAYVASWGMRPDVASNAGDALARLQHAAETGDPYDVALLDFNMPGENGLALARQITASPTLGHTRLILLTSSGQVAGDDPTTGISTHLTKPVRQSRLLDAISLAMALDSNEKVQPVRQGTPGPTHPTPTRIGRRILVAEDQPVNWMLIDRLLTKRGHSAINATDGRRVLKMLESERFDLVLMDCQMPILDGYDTAREIRRREAAEQRGHVPIVAMTANALLGDRERCLAAGMDDYIAKPITHDELDEILARWLGRPQDDLHVLDDARLAELRSMFPRGRMSVMLRDVAAAIGTELDHINAAITQGDGATVAAAVSRLKNSASMIGATQLAAAAAQLESRTDTRGGDGQPRDGTSIQLLIDQWNLTRAAIEDALAQAE
jgi:CheY-like chemotaxis protein/HPt (histidine-containing phosphotransfer) domain-containing protein